MRCAPTRRGSADGVSSAEPKKLVILAGGHFDASVKGVPRLRPGVDLDDSAALLDLTEREGARTRRALSGRT